VAGEEDEMKTDVAQPDVTESDDKVSDIEEPKDTESDIDATAESDSAAAANKHESATGDQEDKPARRGRRKVSISVRALVIGAVIVALVAAIGIVTWLYLGERAKVDAASRQATDNSHAEQVALDYAVGAATIDAKDLGPWKANLVKGTTSELKAKLDEAGKSMEQILVPLQWNSSAVPLVAKVRANANGVYVVDTFVGVNTKTVQAPDGLASTATYSVTIDGNHDWQISDVGGVGSVVGQK
jgi:hypothetical protein